MSNWIELLRLSAQLRGSIQKIGPFAQALIFDDFYADPKAVREAALQMQFAKSKHFYPGRHADLECGTEILAPKLIEIVNSYFLPRNAINFKGTRILKVNYVESDFSIIDTLPNDLHPAQQQPHQDPVPVFGIVYLNDPPQGGTIFFEPCMENDAAATSGYISGSNGRWNEIARLEPQFNRLVIYSGVIPHSADVGTDWTKSPTSQQLRLTQRIMFW